MADNVGGIEYTIEAKVDKLLSANKQANTSLTKIGKVLNKTGIASTILDAKLTILSAGIKKASGFMQSGAKYATVLVTAMTAVTKVAASAGLEIQKMAGLSDVGVERFQELAFGASQVGVSTEKLGDIFKDVQDKMGDFINTGGGELADYFENIAPLVGQTAEEFANLSGPDSLIKFKAGLDAANLSAKEQTFYLESLANDATILAPLLADNAKGFRDAAEEARELNLVLSEAEVQELVDVNKEFNTLLATIAKVTQKIVAENGPQIREAIQQITELFIKAADYADKFFKTMGGGSEIGRLESQAAALSMRLESLQNLTKKEFALNVSSETTDELIQAYLAMEKLSKEYESIQNDSKLNLDIKANRLEVIGERLSLVTGEVETLRAAVDEEFNVYVQTETEKAQNELSLLNGEIYSLQKTAEKPIKVEPPKVGNVANSKQYKEALEVLAQAEKDSLTERERIMEEFAEKRRVLLAGFLPADLEQQGLSDLNTQEQTQLSEVVEPSQQNLALQQGLSITEEMANQVEELDQSFQNLNTTIGDKLVGSMLTFGDTVGDAFVSGISNGESFNEIMKNIGATVTGQVLSSLVSMGVQFGVNALLKSTADGVMEASGAAALAASTTAGVSAAGTLASAYAPAAAAASVATAGGAAVSGGAALAGTYALSESLSLAGGRMNGGGVSAGNAYQVTENGAPEMLTVGGKNILMMGNQSGTVTSNKDLTSGSGGGTTVIINNNASGTEATATSSTKDGQEIINVVVANINARGKVHKAMTSTTTANNKT